MLGNGNNEHLDTSNNVSIYDMKNKKSGKIFALFCIMLMSTLSISTAYALQVPSDEILPSAAAQSSGTCIVDNAGRNFCNDTIAESDCYLWRAGRTIEEVEECRLGTCVPLMQGGCIGNIERIKCEYNNAGRWYDSAPENVQDCSVGCCVSPNNAECSQTEKAVCEKKGYEWSDKSEADCKIVCGAVEYGCCEESGNFLNKHRQECSGKFYGNGLYCSQVIGSGVQACKDIKPGDGSSDLDRFDCYCYDSKGTREGLATSVQHVTKEGSSTGTGDCSATEVCKDPDGAMGELAYCGSTSCVDWCPSCIPSDLKNGESICANVAPGFFNPGSRSAYLKNYIIRCQNGEIKADDSIDEDATREKICVDSVENGVKTTKVILNQYTACIDCGKSGNDYFDILGYIPIFGAPALGILKFTGIGNFCGGDESWSFADKCVNKGEVSFEGKKYKMCDGGSANYDHDMWAPMGSCNPVYTPGTKGKSNEASECGKCAKGGDSLTNVCTEEECESLGDCQFVPDSSVFGANSLKATLTAGAVALGSLTAVYIICQLSPAKTFSILGVPACEQGTSKIGEKMLATNPNLYYWGVYSLLFSGVAADRSLTPETKLETVDGKVKLVDAIISDKAFSRVTPITVNLAAEMLKIIGLPIGGGAPAAIPDAILIAIGKKAMQDNINNLASKYLTAQTNARAAEAAYKNLGEKVAAEVEKKARDDLIAGQAAEKTAFNNLNKELLTKVPEKASETVIKDATKTTVDQAAAGTGEKAKEAGTNAVGTMGTVRIVLAWTGVLLNIYSAGRAMNPGTCKPEEPMSYGEKKTYYGDYANKVCEQCGWGEGQPWCTENRCGILGKLDEKGGCKYIQADGKADGTCVTIPSDDVAPPTVSSMKVEYYDLNKRKLSPESSGIQIDNQNELAFNMTYIKINLTTNEAAQCAYSTDENLKQSEMTPFANDTLFSESHNSGYIPILRNILPNTFTYYIKCVDVSGNANPALENKYFVRFKVAGGPDSAPPVIEYIDPSGFLPEGTLKANFKILAYDSNKVSECAIKINGTETKMTRQSNQRCVTATAISCDLFTANSVSLICTDFTAGNAESLGLEGEQLQAFLEQQSEFTGTKVCPVDISCSDMGSNSVQVNNTIVVTSMFNITIADIEDKYDRSPLFNVTTTRPTVCTYTISNKKYTFNDPAYGIKEHLIKHNETLLPQSNPYRISAECKDIAGTKRTATKDFTVLLDSSSPVLVRAYSDGVILHIATDEEAICVYSPKDCSFAFEDGTGMPEDRVNPSTVSETLWRTDITYYIKCKDKWDNKPSGCTATLKPYEVATI